VGLKLRPLKGAVDGDGVEAPHEADIFEALGATLGPVVGVAVESVWSMRWHLVGPSVL
jgi:hypothetical protein